MGFPSTLFCSAGLLSFLHTAYSIHELSLFTGITRSPPLDITLETLFSVLLIIIGLVLGSEKLKPITWSVWAGKIEENGAHDNPFRAYEDRLSFWDVRSKRQEFADWVREQGSSLQESR